MNAKRTKDRRIARTDALLHEALAALVHEKPYDEIAIQDILDRANVGRSTFYTHFRDKNELFVSGVHDLLRPKRPAAPSQRGTRSPRALLWFSYPVLEHIEERRRAGTVLSDGRVGHVMHEQLRRALRELVADALGSTERRARLTTHVSPSLLANWVATSFILVLNWWVKEAPHLSAREADEHFKQLVEPSLAGLLT